MISFSLQGLQGKSNLLKHTTNPSPQKTKQITTTTFSISSTQSWNTPCISGDCKIVQEGWIPELWETLAFCLLSWIVPFFVAIVRIVVGKRYHLPLVPHNSGGRSFKSREHIGEICCCESRGFRSPLFLSLSCPFPTINLPVKHECRHK